MDGCVILNVRFNRDNGEIPTVLKVPTDITWQDLNLLLKLNFDWQNISVKYLDEDGDFILMSSHSELEEAFRIAQQSNGVLELKVIDCTTSALQRFPTLHTDVTMVTADTPTIKHEVPVDRKQEEIVTDSVEAVKTDKTSALDVTMSAQNTTRAAQNCKTLGQSLGQEYTMDTGDDTMETADDTMETGERVFTQGPLKEKRESKRGARPKHRHMRRAESCYTRCAREIGDYRRSQSQPDIAPRQPLSGVDEESGEIASHDHPVSYSDMMEFLSKLKEDLRCEIVRDVTRKTVKHVLKGLDGAVIQAVQGSKPPANVQPEPSQDRAKTEAGTLSEHPSYIHDSILCDNCDQTVVGARFKCGNCIDYDLCESCELLDGLHDPEHVFLKLRRPWTLAGKLNGQQVPLLRCLVYKPTEEQTDRDDSSAQPRWVRFKEKMVRMQEKFKKKEEKMLEKHKKKEEKLKRRLEHERSLPVKREKLDFIPPRRRHGKFGAELIEDLTIPDGTRVQPGTKLVKTWILKNCGNMCWDSSTKLRMVWGSMEAVERQVEVPHLTPGDQGPVTVELIAPATPGRYQSHWKMQYTEKNFGHRVWCAVIVEAKEILEPIAEDSLKVIQEDHGQAGLETDGDLSERVPMIPLVSAIPVIDPVPSAPLLAACPVGESVPHTSVTQLVSASPVLDTVLMTPLVPATPIPDQEDKVVDTIEEKLTSAAAVVAQLQRDKSRGLAPTDLLSFEMVDRENQDVSHMIQAATPNNTPAVETPPKSPVFGVLSNSSSVEIVGEEDSSPEMIEYVKEKMAALTFNADMSYELESVSSSTDDDEDDDDSTSSSDGDFFIVPLPDCFQPDKPWPSSCAAASWDENDNMTDVKSVDEILSVSLSVSAPTLSPVELLTADEEQGELVTNTQQDQDILSSQQLCEANKMEETENKVEETENRVEETQNMLEETENRAEETENRVEETQNMVEESESKVEEPETEPMNLESKLCENKDSDDGPADCSGSNDETDPQAKTGEFANQLMNTAVSAATRAASHAYSTAKEVFYTWQGKQNTWMPPAETFKLPESTWIPPKDDWTPPEDNWTPPESNWTPPAGTWTPDTQNIDSDVAMEPNHRLLEMGFYDTQLNAELLARFDGDLEKVVQELLRQSDNDWATQRH